MYGHSNHDVILIEQLFTVLTIKATVEDGKDEVENGGCLILSFQI